MGRIIANKKRTVSSIFSLVVRRCPTHGKTALIVAWIASITLLEGLADLGYTARSAEDDEETSEKKRRVRVRGFPPSR
jgi:hypothetical protein